ncbi:HigA family addiction module antitoxin [Andreprevotia chitinilytica]|uniref:HigA family addiction module antitoxin n=1 Tax=Andreprevotia chitinilytica TaxID=396808 RepID=UPI000552EA45|nr:HigA family addiction module antitoxin [Andreprevotia chitinilytica]
MDMHNPAHPGEILAGWIDDLHKNITTFAEHIGISRVQLSKIVNGRAGITADMDLRLADALGTTPGYWLRLQAQHDLWQARQHERPHIGRLAA